jgi:hypothetical protein
MNIKSLLQTVLYELGISDLPQLRKQGDIEVSRIFLKILNEYFFQTYDDIGMTHFEEEELEYFSEFHKFWEANHKKIIDARVISEKATKTAHLLSKAVRTYGDGILKVRMDARGLRPEQIAQVRFFTANQDFRVPPEDQFELFIKSSSAFDEKIIFDDPEQFLKRMKITKLSQTDKRISFAKNAADFLIGKGIIPFQIAEAFDYDAVKIRQALIDTKNMGYGHKKANMFIRDMVELGVWERLDRYDMIDVASDINTMKLALRTGILKSSIPLFSSFIDVFCHQYSYIDERSAAAWREVWKDWKDQDPDTAPSSPCEMDALLYGIGRDYCKRILREYECADGHTFYHFSGRLKKCRVCMPNKHRANASVKSAHMPCQVEPSLLPRKKGKLYFSKDNRLADFDGKCIFDDVCRPKDPGFVAFDPPKSISIKGRTGWTSSHAQRDRGGGGMMG